MIDTSLPPNNTEFDVERFVDSLFEPGDVIELRCHPGERTEMVRNGTEFPTTTAIWATTMNELFDEARDLAIRCVPELNTVPFRIIKCPPMAGCLAYVGGEYQGPGVTLNISTAVGDDRDNVLGVALHELAHCLPLLPLEEYREPSPKTRAIQAEVFKLQSQTPPSPESVWLPDRFHDFRFIRRVLHLGFRARLNGSDIPLPAFGSAGPSYGLSLLSRYRRVLGDEPERMQHETFKVIEATPLPKAFQKLWTEDSVYRYQVYERLTKDHDNE